MPRPGGVSDKLGNSYELWWTVHIMLQLLKEDRGVICIEPFDEKWPGLEFWVDRPDGVREGHQAKRQNGYHGRWSLSELKKRGVLPHLKEHLKEQNRTAHFVSREGVEFLGELVGRARRANSAAEFLENKTQIATKALKKFMESWGVAKDDEAFRDLCRIYVRTISWEDLKDLVEAEANHWFDEPPEAVVGFFYSVINESFSKEMGPPEIWSALKRKGLLCRPREDVQALSQQMEKLRLKYWESRRDFGGYRVEREASSTVKKKVEQCKLVWVVGDAGAGKSEVVQDVVQQLLSEWVILPLCVDQLGDENTPKKIGEFWGLPTSPVDALARVADGKDALLVVDQLDAFSAVSGRRSNQLKAVLKVVSAASHHKNIRVLIACREFDLKNDRMMARFDEGFDSCETVKVEGFSGSEVEEVLLNVEEVPSKARELGGLSPAKKRLLSLPLHLALFVQSRDRSFTGEKDLFEGFVREKRRAVELRVTNGDWHQVVETLLKEMSDSEQLFVSWNSLCRWHPFAEAMVSEGVLRKERGRVGFVHELVFDYFFCLFFDREKPLWVWLQEKDNEQGLFRRAQVRQMLAFRRTDSLDRYLGDLRDLLLGNGVRFHLEWLVVAWLSFRSYS